MARSSLPAVFHAIRELREGFRGSFYEPEPIYGLAKAVLAHPVGFRGLQGFHYYGWNPAPYAATILYWAVRSGEEGWDQVEESLPENVSIFDSTLESSLMYARALLLMAGLDDRLSEQAVNAVRADDYAVLRQAD